MPVLPSLHVTFLLVYSIEFLPTAALDTQTNLHTLELFCLLSIPKEIATIKTWQVHNMRMFGFSWSWGIMGSKYSVTLAIPASVNFTAK